MENILTYAENRREKFNSTPFNCVDALILCWLSYFSYPDYLKGGKHVALKDFEQTGLLPDKQMYATAFSPKKSKRLFTLATKNPRFYNMQFSHFIDENDEQQEKQFGAVCIKICKNTYFLSFRGTDPSFTGWKEDFNLAYGEPVPSQLAAEQYLTELAAKHPLGKFYLGGHSKGGNLAVYAAVNAKSCVQDRIINVFNFDGPGFIDGVCGERGLENVDKKILKYIPEASLFGMLFETRNNYFVVKSKSVSVLQHVPFSWAVNGCDFKYLKNRSKTSIKLERALNCWVTELTIAERERMIKIIYGALNTLDTRDFNVVLKTFYRQIPALYREYKRLEPDDRIFFDGKIKRLKQLLANKDN